MPLKGLNANRRPLGKITREAPPGPGMTEAEFRVAMDTLARDAARWRWAMRNWQTFDEIVRQSETAMDVQYYVDSGYTV